MEKVAGDLVFPEGPVWHPDGFLLFSDVHNATIEQLQPGGGSRPWLDKGIKTNGLILSNDAKTLYACCHSELQLLAIDLQTRAVTVLADGYNGRKFHNVNDVAVDAEGNVYFTDPKWGAKPGDVQGVYCWSRGGKLTLAATVDKQPNGLVVSPDQKWLYVARTGGNDIWRFPLQGGGVLGEGKKWAQLDPTAGPDGMTVDRKGNVYQTQAGDGKVTVISPEGKVLHQFKVFDRMATNCEFEGKNESILYVTGGGRGKEEKSGAVYRVRLDDE